MPVKYLAVKIHISHPKKQNVLRQRISGMRTKRDISHVSNVKYSKITYFIAATIGQHGTRPRIPSVRFVSEPRTLSGPDVTRGGLTINGSSPTNIWSVRAGRAVSYVTSFGARYFGVTSWVALFGRDVSNDRAKPTATWCNATRRTASRHTAPCRTESSKRTASRERDTAPKFRISTAVRKLTSRKADGTLTRWREHGGIGNLWNDGTWDIFRVENSRETTCR